MPLVEEPGEIAVRGGIVDVFPPQLPRPVRIELLRRRDRVDPRVRRGQPALPGQARRARSPRRRASCSSIATLVIERSEAMRELGRETSCRRARRRVDRLAAARPRAARRRGAGAAAAARPGERRSTSCPRTPWSLVDDPDGRPRAGSPHYFEEATSQLPGRAGAGRLVAPPDALLLDPARLRAARARAGPGDPRAPRRRPRAARDPGARALRVDALPRRAAPRARSRRAPTSGRCAPLVDALADGCSERLAHRARLHARSPRAERLRALLAEYGLERARRATRGPVWRWSAPGRIEIRVAPLSEGFVVPARAARRRHRGGDLRAPREDAGAPRSWREGAAVEGLGAALPGRLPGARRPRHRRLSRPGRAVGRRNGRASSCASSTKAATSSSCRSIA